MGPRWLWSLILRLRKLSRFVRENGLFYSPIQVRSAQPQSPTDEESWCPGRDCRVYLDAPKRKQLA